MATNILASLGSASGIDTQQLVADLTAAQKAPQQGRIDTKTEQYDAKLSAYGILKSGLAEFQSAMAPLADPAVFNAKAINVPTTDVITFNSLTAEAPAGNYQLEVSQVATTQSLAINSTQTDADAALNKAGKLTFNTGQWSYDDPLNPGDPNLFTANADKPSFDIDITADDSLATIAQKINDADSEIQASVINIDGQFQLLVTAESGVKNALQITSDDPSLADFDFNKTSHANVVETQQGKDAQFKLNGLDITRSSNTIADVIVGLDFTLNKEDVGNNISFSISQDKGAAETAINGFIEAYNLLQGIMKPLVGITQDDSNNLVRGDLSRDGAAKSLASLITQTMSSTVQGLKVTDAYSSLGSIGVNTNTDGTLELDDEQFNLVVKNDFDKLASLFAVNTGSSSNFIELNTGSFAAQATAGEYAVHIDTAPAKGWIDGAVATDFALSGEDFTIKVNGVESNSISLLDDYASIDALADDLQAKINGDTLLKAGFASVSVTVEAGALKITSNDFGGSSNVSFVEASAGFSSKLGLDKMTTGTNGIDVVGTINGEATLGSGNIMLPAISSAAYGLNLSFKQDTPTGDYSVSFSRGLAGDLSLLLSTALSGGGQIAKSEESIADGKKVLVVDQENLDRKMTAYQERLSSQYAAMERIVASLNQTKSQLDGLIDRLPFTAAK
ncbi:MAG: flagellar filament capping protein FliD [Oceanospirillaceae bacterium]